MNLLVDGKVVLSATGQNNNKMTPASWEVRRWAGQQGTLQIVDKETGAWGNIGIDDIIFSDQPGVPRGPLAEQPDFGTMGLALLAPLADDAGATALAFDGAVPAVFAEGLAPEPASRRSSGQRGR